MKVIVNGALGHMGREIVRLSNDGYRGAELSAAVDINGVMKSVCEFSGDADVIIDFSHHSAVTSLLDYAVKRGISAVIATTGHTEEERAAIADASKKIPVFYSANMSLGVALLCETAVKVALAMPEADIEIVETHHNRKLDAPSGTALMLARAIQGARGGEIVCGRNGISPRKVGDISISAVRRGNILGIHEIFFSTPAQTISLKHEAHDRALFAEGTLAAAQFLMGKPAGLYDMTDMF